MHDLFKNPQTGIEEAFALSFYNKRGQDENPFRFAGGQLRFGRFRRDRRSVERERWRRQGDSPDPPSADEVFQGFRHSDGQVHGLPFTEL